MAKHPEILLVSSDEGYDWIVVDGEIKDSGHGLDMEALLIALGIPYKLAVVDEKWLEECSGATPDDIEDFKLVRR